MLGETYVELLAGMMDFIPVFLLFLRQTGNHGYSDKESD